jgi:hypothetical protein
VFENISISPMHFMAEDMQHFILLPFVARHSVFNIHVRMRGKGRYLWVISITDVSVISRNSLETLKEFFTINGTS